MPMGERSRSDRPRGGAPWHAVSSLDSFVIAGSVSSAAKTAARSSSTHRPSPRACSTRWPKGRSWSTSPTRTRGAAASERRMCGSPSPEEPGLPLPGLNLDSGTRRSMLEELDQDIAERRLYLSTVLSGRGRADFEGLLRAAIERGTDASLADKLAVGERVIPPQRWQKPGEERTTTARRVETAKALHGLEPARAGHEALGSGSGYGALRAVFAVEKTLVML